MVKMYRCKLCGAWFVHMNSCVYHLTKVHDIKYALVEDYFDYVDIKKYEESIKNKKIIEYF